MTTPTASPSATTETASARGASRRRSEPTGTGAEGSQAAAPRSKKKVLVILLLILAIAGGAYTFLKPAPATSAEPEPGVVVRLDPVTLNLDAGRYLKVGIALQFTAASSSGGGGHGSGGGEEPDGFKALDLVIEQLSNRKVAELNTAVGRDAAKDVLLAAIKEAYHGDVMDIYFTDFVMQ